MYVKNVKELEFDYAQWAWLAWLTPNLLPIKSSSPPMNVPRLGTFYFYKRCSKIIARSANNYIWMLLAREAIVLHLSNLGRIAPTSTGYLSQNHLVRRSKRDFRTNTMYILINSGNKTIMEVQYFVHQQQIYANIQVNWLIALPGTWFVEFWIIMNLYIRIEGKIGWTVYETVNCCCTRYYAPSVLLIR